ncbi:MAG: hypothetical protein ABI645_05600 [Pseudomonadota bacterium]
MNSSADHAADHPASGASHNNADRTGTSGELHKLLADIEDLVARVSHVKDPNIARVRSTVQEALVSARDVIVDSATRIKSQGRQAVAGTDAFVRGSPWQAMGIAALLGVAVGYLASRRT